MRADIVKRFERWYKPIDVCGRMLTYADVCGRMQVRADIVNRFERWYKAGVAGGADKLLVYAALSY